MKNPKKCQRNATMTKTFFWWTDTTSFLHGMTLKKLPKPKKTDKKVCFSYKIEKMDVNFVRTLIDLCYEKGYAYDHDTDICFIYVSNEKDDKRIAHLNEKQLAKIKRFSLTEFCDFIGYDSVKKYSDTEFLTDFYSKLTL